MIDAAHKDYIMGGLDEVGEDLVDLGDNVYQMVQNFDPEEKIDNLYIEVLDSVSIMLLALTRLQNKLKAIGNESNGESPADNN